MRVTCTEGPHILCTCLSKKCIHTHTHKIDGYVSIVLYLQQMHLSLKEILIDSMRVELEVACVDNIDNCQRKFSKQYKTKIEYIKSFFF